MQSSTEPGPDAQRNWDRTLARVVTDDGYVDYDLLEEPENRQALDAYVARLAEAATWRGKLTRDWHAQYLNAYNALVLFQVLERDRPSSVLAPRRLVPVGGAAFFLETQFELGPDWLSLSEIEHERVRQKELDIRDHAALNCASMSCPPLRDELYRSRHPTLRAQLDDQMSRWVMDDARGLRIEEDQVVFNPIFDWYARDFSFWTAGRDLCAIAAEYSSGRRRLRLESMARRGCPHTFFEYDWALNDASNRP